MPLYRYLLTSTAISQSWVGPILAFFILLAVGTSSDKGPLLSAYSFNVVVVLVCSTWLTVAVVSHQDAVQRQVVTVAAGGLRRVLGATVSVALTGCLLMIVFGLGYPIVIGRHQVTAEAIVVGCVAQLAAAFVGVALGLLTSRLVIRRLGVAVLTAASALVVLLLVRPLPPIGPLIQVLYGATHPSRVLAEVLGCTALAAVLLIASATVTKYVADHRE